MSEYFEYTYLQTGIHRFKWLSRSENSAKAYYDFIVKLYGNLPDKSATVRILHDYQHLSFIPLANVFPSIKSLQSMYPHLERKIAYLSNDPMTETLLKSITDTVNRTGRRKFFKSNEEHLAIKWLLDNQP